MFASCACARFECGSWLSAKLGGKLLTMTRRMMENQWCGRKRSWVSNLNVDKSTVHRLFHTCTISSPNSRASYADAFLLDLLKPQRRRRRIEACCLSQELVGRPNVETTGPGTVTTGCWVGRLGDAHVYTTFKNASFLRMGVSLDV